ncbi:MAG: dinitrogenase iron-molybdenum cofactor [Firmicutes bacterium]|nr:dinitrogenase iron-molybdenum cofactor [Bacillota bacterium]
MKIAIATDGSVVAPHFGRCGGYTIYDVENGSIVDKTVVPNPGHEPGFLPEYLQKLNVSCIIAGGMGVRAKELFEAKNIEAIVGVTGPVDDAAQSYASGVLTAGDSLCERGQGKGRMDPNHDHHGNCGK